MECLFYMQIQLQQPFLPQHPRMYSRSTQATNRHSILFGNHLALQPVNIVRIFMNAINNNRLFELFVSDFLGMTFPRTVIETKKRGMDMGRETLLREIVGGLTPVFVCGWVGSLLAFGLEKQFYNPKKMSFRAWIDSNLLNHFADITHNLLPQTKTIQELKQGIIKKVISQIQSTDGIYKLHQFKDYFPENGTLPKQIQTLLVEKMARYSPRRFHPGGILTKKLQQAQAKFIKSLAHFAIEKGALTHRVVLMHPDGFPYMDIGPRELTDILGKTQSFIEEFVVPATGTLAKTPNKLLTSLCKKSIACRLFHDTGKMWFTKTFLPRMADGAIPYMYKLKRVLVGVPLLATAIFAFSFARINNWLTSRRYAGEVFFPGERSIEDPKLHAGSFI